MTTSFNRMTGLFSLFLVSFFLTINSGLAEANERECPEGLDATQLKNESDGKENSIIPFACITYLLQRIKELESNTSLNTEKGTLSDLMTRVEKLEMRSSAPQTTHSATLPEKAVVPFFSDGCPTGWERFEPASGRFLVGVTNRGNVDARDQVLDKAGKTHPSFTLPYLNRQPQFQKNLPYRVTTELDEVHLPSHTHWRFQRHSSSQRTDDYYSSQSVPFELSEKSVHAEMPSTNEASSQSATPVSGTEESRRAGPYTWIRTDKGTKHPFLNLEDHGHVTVPEGGTFAPAMEYPVGGNEPFMILPPYIAVYFCVKSGN